MHEYLKETEFLNYSDPAIQQAVGQHSSADCSEKENAVSLYYYARDAFLYDPYVVSLDRSNFHASEIFKSGRGYCVAKAILYATFLRGAGIASRLGFADVKNHMTSARLARVMKTDTFYYHGYTEVFLDGKWLKVTPAFNIELCDKAGTLPLEFDGTEDSVFHPFSKNGSKHMEYVRDHGTFADLPYDLIIAKFEEYYPNFMDILAQKADRDFQNEVSPVD